MASISCVTELPCARRVSRVRRAERESLRISCCIGYGIIVYALLYWDKTDWLSIGLGVVLMAMVLLFLIVDIRLGVDFAA